MSGLPVMTKTHTIPFSINAGLTDSVFGADGSYSEGVLLLPYYSVVFAADLSSLADFVVDAVFVQIFNRDAGFGSGHNTS